MTSPKMSLRYVAGEFSSMARKDTRRPHRLWIVQVLKSQTREREPAVMVSGPPEGCITPGALSKGNFE
jgi:hypothetical protein